MAENNNAFPYLGYQETVGFESKKEQIKEMVQGIIDENNAVDNNQSELIAENTKKIEENTINDEKTVQNLEDEIAERKRMGNILNDKISVVQSSVEAEQTRAKSAEESLQAQINLLVEQHPSDIEQLKLDLNSETERAMSAEQANAEAIATEQARAEAKEAELAQAISDEQARAMSAEQANAEAIATEKDRAEAKEAELAQAISDETERAKGEESAIRSEFAEADSKLQSEIDAIEVGAGLAIDGSYVVDSTRQYIKDAKSLAEADKILDYNLMQEAHERWVQDENIKSSIKELSNSLEAEKVERWNQDQKIRTDFTSADNALNEAIVAEQSRAMSAEQANAEAIAAEQVRAEAKEAELVQAIADEANVRGEQDANLHGEIVKLNETLVYNLGVLNEAYKVEQDARISGDNSLDERIKAIELVKLGDLEYSLVVDGVDKGTVNIPKDQFLKSVEHIIDENGKDFLVFSFEVKDSDELVVQKIDVSKYIDIYTAGHGLNVQNNEFSIKLDDTTEKYISVSENGLKLFGIDNKISDVQNNLHSELKTAETSLEAKITNESARATQKETELLNSITAESETARKAEKANAEAIAAEQVRAEAKEAELAQAIADEEARAEGKEDELSQAISDEQTRAMSAEQANAEAIAAEQARAEGEETAIRGEVDAIKNELIEKVNGHVIVIDGNIRSVEEKIAAEQDRAMASEQSNAEAIVAEQNRAEAKEYELAQAISDETERAKDEESAIRIEFAESDSIMRGEIESNFSEEIQKVNESILSNTTLINELNISLADEQARAESKEAELSQAIIDEQTRADGKEAELAQSIATEQARAEAKEAELEDADAILKADVEANYALKSELPVVPTKVSELENDVPYLTEHQSLEAYSTIAYVDGKISEMSAIISALEDRIKVLENRVYTPNELISKISELKSGDILDIELSSDITMSNLDRLVIPSGSVVNLNLNGNTIKYLDETIMFRVEGELVIENGSVEGNGYVASANEGGSIIVKNGSYTCSVTCFQSNGGSVKIYDGYYNCTSEKYGTTYTLNCIDAQAKKAQAEGRRLIDVYGGTFVDYNPQNSTSENPVMNFVAEGYKSVEQVDSEGNVTYIVVKE